MISYNRESQNSLNSSINEHDVGNQSKVNSIQGSKHSVHEEKPFENGIELQEVVSDEESKPLV